MTKAEAKILLALNIGPAPVGLIAQRCLYCKGHVSSFTGHLEETGLIVRRPWPDDPEAKYAYALTVAGRSALEEARLVSAPGHRRTRTNAPTATHLDVVDPSLTKLLNARW